MEGYGPKGLNKPLGLACEDAEGFEGAAVTSTPSPCEQGSNEGWGLGVEALKGLGVRGDRGAAGLRG